MDQYGIPDLTDFDKYSVASPNQSTIVRQRLYDYQIYPQAGVTQLSFFQNPIGAGVTSAIGAVVGTAKTQWDTNMNLAGQLSSGMKFLCTSIEIRFVAGRDATANTFLPANPSVFAAVAAAAVAGQLNDVLTFNESGQLEFNVLDKNILRETPLGAFPSKTYVGQDVGIASNSATTAEVATVTGRAMGRPYYLDVPVALEPAMNFVVNLKWPAAVAMPSGFNARVGVILDGFAIRAVQ